MQPLKQFICSKCGKELANRHNLSRHKKTSQSSTRNWIFDDSYAEPKTTAVQRPIESYYEPKPKKNPRIETLLDEIINDDPDITPQAVHKGYSIVPPTPTIVYSPIKKPPQSPIMSPPTKTPKLKKVLPKSSSPPRTKGDIMGYSSDENSDDSSTEVSIDIKPPIIKFLPATVEGLSARFNKLFCEFVRQKKHEHRNELVSLR